MAISNVLCVCEGNRDRSPFMAAVLKLLLSNTLVCCESAGILPKCSNGSSASKLCVTAASRIGLDLSKHKTRLFNNVCWGDFNLIVCANTKVVVRLLELGVPIETIYNIAVDDPFPLQFQEDYDLVAEKIIAAMFRVVVRFFSQK